MNRRMLSALLHAQRHEPQLAVGVGDQQEDGFLAVLLQLIDALLDVGGVAHRLLRHLDDHLAGAQAFLGGVGRSVDTGDDDALDAVLDLVTGAQILAQRCEIEAERLLRDRFLRGLGGLGRRLHRLVAVLEAAERDFPDFLRALADDDDVDLLADGGIGDDARQILRLLDVLAVELDDDVAGLDAGGLCRTLVLDAGDQGAARRLDIEAFGNLVGDLLDADAKPAAPKLAELPQRIDHAGDGLGGHRKADADRAARRRDDQRVDANHLAVEIEQRTAGIAAVDGGVGLNVVVIGTGADVTIARRHDARRHGAAKAERVADRDHPFAKPQLVGIAELDRHQRLCRRLEFQHRKIGLLVDAYQLGLDLGAVVHDDVDLVGIRDDVIVGHGDASGVDDEAGAERVGLARLQIPASVTALGIAPGAATAVLEKIVEEFLERRARRQLRYRAPALGAALGFDGLRG